MPRKKQKLPAEILELVDNVNKSVSDENNIGKRQRATKRKTHAKEVHSLEETNLNIEDKEEIVWDIPEDKEILYFDTNLSYEVTGYRPINESKGLDFNPSWFTETRETYLRTGHYCSFPRGTKAFGDFWREQYRRCRDGMRVNGYTITGDHYFFLNFYLLKDLVNVEKAGAGRTDIFPEFLVIQYEWFHYVELARRTRQNAGMLKSREMGYSEIEASIVANSYNTIRGSINLCCAYSEFYLDKLLEKVWGCLTFLNNKTDGGFFKSRQVVDTARLKRASLYRMENGLKNEVGWKSQIQGIIADKPSKLSGDRTDLLLFEECFGKDTEVIMSDYSIKYILDILIGNFVLGLDGTPQEVMNTCSGVDLLYKICLKRGNDYIVNSKHKLYFERRPRVDKLLDFIDLMTVLEYNNLSDYNKRTTYGKTNGPIQYNEDKCDIDPYYLGLWLGDGFSDGASSIVINTYFDTEIYNYVTNFFEKNNLKTQEDQCSDCGKCVKIYGSRISGTHNPLNEQFRKYNLINNKHIPKEVYFSTLEYRLLVLAGLIDTDGNINKNKRYEIAMARKYLIQEIGLLALTCGFDTHYTLRTHKSGYGQGKESYRVAIQGDVRNIPIKVERKKCTNIRFNTTNSTPIKIEDIGKGEYYGITLKSYGKNTDNLFLLKDFTIVHNCGLFYNLAKTYTMADALVGLVGSLWGLRILGGSAGEAGPQVEGIRKMYYNPSLFGILPYRHSYTSTGEETVTAFFVPAFRIIKDKKLLDNRGFISEKGGREFFDKVRALKVSDPRELITYSAQYCYNAEEALSLEGENKFNKVNIAEQLTQIRALKRCPKIEKGYIEYLYKDGVHLESNISGFKWIPNEAGNVQILEHPLWTLQEQHDEKGDVTWRPPTLPIRDLYVIGIDGIDIGSALTSEVTKDPSDFCLTVYRRVYGMKEPQFVALYKDRPRDVRECYKVAIKLALYYNAVINIEATRLGIIPYARERNVLRLFMKRPRATLSDTMRNNNKQFGTPATAAIIDHQTDLIANYVEDYCHMIWFDEMLDELNRYSNDNKNKFDIIAAMAMALLADEELLGVVPRNMQREEDKWEDIGYYTDSEGRRRYGIIPLTQQLVTNGNISTYYEDFGPRTSDPRLYHGFV